MIDNQVVIADELSINREKKKGIKLKNSKMARQSSIKLANGSIKIKMMTFLKRVFGQWKYETFQTLCELE